MNGYRKNDDLSRGATRCPRLLVARLALGLTPLVLCFEALRTEVVVDGSRADDGLPHRSPIDLALSAGGSRLLTANQIAGSVSLVDPKSGRVLAEVLTGDRTAGVAPTCDGRRGAVTHWYGYDLAVLDVGPDAPKLVGRVEVGPEPRGVVIASDGKTAYVRSRCQRGPRVDLETPARSPAG